MGEENHADVWAALRDPNVVHGMAEDYRAGLGVDREHDAADRAGSQKVECPTLSLESVHDDLDIHGDPAEIWRPWLSSPISHVHIDSGHHQAEQAPEAVAETIAEFIRSTCSAALHDP